MIYYSSIEFRSGLCFSHTEHIYTLDVIFHKSSKCNCIMWAILIYIIQKVVHMNIFVSKTTAKWDTHNQRRPHTICVKQYIYDICVFWCVLELSHFTCMLHILYWYLGNHMIVLVPVMEKPILKIIFHICLIFLFHILQRLYFTAQISLLHVNRYLIIPHQSN